MVPVGGLSGLENPRNKLRWWIYVCKHFQVAKQHWRMLSDQFLICNPKNIQGNFCVWTEENSEKGGGKSLNVMLSCCPWQEFMENE